MKHGWTLTFFDSDYGLKKFISTPYSYWIEDKLRADTEWQT